MLEILKKAGFPAAVATLVVILITAVPIWYQIETTQAQNAKIAELEAQVKALAEKK